MLKHTMTYLDAGETKQTRFLVLQPLVNLVGVVTIDVRLLHKRERDTVVTFTECGDLAIISRFLSTKLKKIDQTINGKVGRSR